MSPWTEARLQSTWSSADSSVSPRRLYRVAPSPSGVQVHSVDRAEQLVRQTATTVHAATSRTAPGSLDTVIPRSPEKPPVETPPTAAGHHSSRPSGGGAGEGSPANSRRERYGIATIMPRGTQRQQTPAVSSAQPGTTLVAETTQAARAAAENSFDSVPTDISDSTSRSRSGEPVTTTSMDSSSSATGAATAGSGGGGGSMDTDSTDKSTSAGSHKLHQMRDDSGYKSLETQQSLGKSAAGAGAATASLLATIGTRSMDRAPPGLLTQPATSVVGRPQYSLEVPSLPMKFGATSPQPKKIVVPVLQLAVPDAKPVAPQQHLDEATSGAKTLGHGSISEFFTGISSTGSGQQPTADDSNPKKQHNIPFVAEAAFLGKFAERTQTVGRALTSSFDRIRQQAGSFLSKTSAVVRGDAEAPISLPIIAPLRRASSSECRSSSWTERDSKLTPVSDQYHRRSNSGEVFTKDIQPQCGLTASFNTQAVYAGGQSLHPSPAMPPPSPGLLSSDGSTRDQTTFASPTSSTGSKFVGPETVSATMATLSMTSLSPRHEACKEMLLGSHHQLLTTDAARGLTHRQERFVHAAKSGVLPSAIQSSASTHLTRTHARQPHYDTTASSQDIRRGNIKTASKRRREYRSKKQVQEVHHSGSLTETTSHPPAPMPPVHGYSEVVGEPSSSDNSLEQPSTTSGGGSGASDASSSCEALSDPRQRRGLSRDYSIDAKTDALFNEFVKYDPNLSGGRRKNVSGSRQSDTSKDQQAGEASNRGPVDIVYRSDLTSSALHHHGFVAGAMRPSIEEEDESLEL